MDTFWSPKEAKKRSLLRQSEANLGTQKELQKRPFWAPKGALLRSKRRLEKSQKEVFWSPERGQKGEIPMGFMIGGLNPIGIPDKPKGGGVGGVHLGGGARLGNV